MVKCALCGKEFYQKDPKHKTCFDCAKKNWDKPGQAQQTNGLSDEYINDIKAGYFKEKTNLKDSMIIKHPDNIAKEFGADRRLSYTQLRKFYDRISHLKRLIEIRGEYNVVLPEILQLGPLVAEASGKTKVPRIFKDFIDINLEQVKKGEDYFMKGFHPHFQAVLAYFKYYNPQS
ncbi:MAG: type III-A CRISPR-associated protein Csm2 [Candidatus Margulisbacteria bacterium]|nr:type III-A CRISPR-associated protein Csm2 [Candidatus Margulisiibacteriota bacterium]